MKGYKNYLNKFKAIACSATLVLATIVPAMGVNAAAMPAETNEENLLWGQRAIYANDADPLSGDMETEILRMSPDATADDVEVDSTNKTLKFKNLNSERMDIDAEGWTLIFEGTNTINTEMIIEEEMGVSSVTITVLPSSTLTVKGKIGHVVKLGSDTIADVELNKEKTVTYPDYEYVNPETGEYYDEPILVGETSYDVIVTDGPVKFTNSKDASTENAVEETKTTEEVKTNEETSAASEVTTPAADKKDEVNEENKEEIVIPAEESNPEPDYNASYNNELSSTSSSIKEAKAGEVVVLESGDSLPSYIMAALKDNPNATLRFKYTYQDVDYDITITGRQAAKVFNPAIEWYGPVWLKKHIK